MIKFLLKGLLRDKSRSRLPVLVVTIGVTLTVLMHAYITGFMGDIIEINARFSYGHLKVMTRGYADNMRQSPNDLALLNVSSLIDDLKEQYPGTEWSPRIQFAGLVDIPDENGETRSQGPAAAMGLELLAQGSAEIKRMNFVKSLVRGQMPSKQNEVLLSDEFSRKLGVNPGDRITFISSTMNGSMSITNFVLAGTVSMGHEALDKGTLIADIQDARNALDMEDSAGEILGFLKGGFYIDEVARSEAEKFNSASSVNTDGFTPVMKTLSEQGTMGTYVNMTKLWSFYISLVFIIAMSLVLWNAGLLGGLRRYGEFGIRLAMGEEKGHIYSTLIYESIMIGLAGSLIGTFFGLLFAWLIQKYGIDISGLMRGSSMMLPTVIRARISPVDFYLGFIPGLASTVIGTMLSGIGIYKRQTAKLFKELEA
ncbi:MAG TPA: FtsX-like permease family protein [Bacteroidales bacterium]|jgi:putative ABC transport system permease protein|nr:FtsX-like permease family protein [Bacteroidales bacterium]OQB57516.1 MAG: outer membrane-specific lipoprotein transporter subunit LolE [Bacteroidetes bacterium ADurb.Bin145]HQK68315.1 FtsX-like permease family protein [Bacteroidales bacterium]